MLFFCGSVQCKNVYNSLFQKYSYMRTIGYGVIKKVDAEGVLNYLVDFDSSSEIQQILGLDYKINCTFWVTEDSMMKSFEN